MNITQELREILEEHHKITERLVALIDNAETAELGREHWAEFDPETDAPPVSTNVDGSRQQRDWGAIILWGSLAALNARQKRGATRDELVEIAKRAGYRDGRGWNAWTGWVNLSDGRWIDQAGIAFLTTYYERQQRRVPVDVQNWIEAGGLAAD